MTEPTMTGNAGAVTGGVRILLRLEGLGLLILTLLLYASSHLSWLAFAVFFFAPDLSFAGYLAGPRVGAAIYNIAHDTFIPIMLIVVGYLLEANHIVLATALIWLAHIGFDRALGYGLKYQSGFSFTHLGRVGKAGQPGTS